MRLPATTGIVWLAFWATIFFCGVRCLQADRRPLSGFSVSLPSGRRWTRLAEGRAVPFMTGRCRYLPILPLALSGLLLIWIGGDCNRVKRQRGRSPSRHRRCRKARAKARGRLRRGRRLPADLALLQVHHGSMPPTPKPANAKEQKGSGKNKTKTEKAQVSTVEYGLPATMVVALQSISSRATQDLWGSAAFAADDLTAEQLAQRRTNAMSKHSKRLVGNVRAKADLTSSLGTWFARLSQHMVGLVGRIRAISQKVDEDLMAAVEEMQQHLATQPSTATSEQIAQAMHSLGPVWSQLQEQEVIRLAASVRAFGAVAAPSSSSGPHSFVNASPVTVSPHLAPDNSSEVSFGDATGSIRAPPLAFTDPVTPTPGSRWQKRRALATSGRPSKSPRRELGDPPVPWKAEATGRTPESQRRTSQTQIDSGPELIPAQEATTAQTHGQSWFGHWLVLVEFLVNNGGEEIGELTSDPEQEAILPLTATGADDSAVGHLARQIWDALHVVMEHRSITAMPALCNALQDLLLRLRSDCTTLPRVKQGVVLAAQLVLGNVLDPYSFAPATAQEWLLPATLVERGGPFKGYLPQAMSATPEVIGLLSRPCPFLPQAEVLPETTEAAGSL